MNRLVTAEIIDETKWVGRDEGGLHVLHKLQLHTVYMGRIVHQRCFKAVITTHLYDI